MLCFLPCSMLNLHANMVFCVVHGNRLLDCTSAHRSVSLSALDYVHAALYVQEQAMYSVHTQLYPQFCSSRVYTVAFYVCSLLHVWVS